MWQFAHDDPKCFAGALWHDAHEPEVGCVNAQETPGWRWLEAQAAVRLCPAGAAWQSAHAEDACLNTVRSNGTAVVWHVAHAVPKCFAGGVWHDVHSGDDGCEKTQLVPGWWQVAHSPRASWLGW